MVDPRPASPCGRFADELTLGLDGLEALLPGLECFADEWRLGGAGTALGDDVVPGGDIAKFGFVTVRGFKSRVWMLIANLGKLF
jgi:hypothetical protein